MTHFSKNTGGSDPVERITGSIAFAAQARIVLVVGKRKSEDDSSEHVLCRAKSNIGLDSGGFAYEIQQSTLEQYPDIFASTVQWGDAIEGTAREILTETKESIEEKSSVLQDAKDYLIEILSEGELPWEEISQGARPLLISDRTLKRAKSALGILHRKIGKRSHWFLPEQVGQTDSTKPADSLEQLAHLTECPANAASGVTEPNVPSKPLGNLEQLKARRASNIAKKLNKIGAEGMEKLKVRP
ncbi:MAG: hypothetical protein LIP28_09155 [Deltaproteobacteria bacterium]|nr:hypothetical protein [Deltaproteobacteria bacterium]